MLYQILNFLTFIDLSKMVALTIVLFILGIILVVIEMITPGVGVPGVLGVLSLIGGIILASQQVPPLVLVLIIALVLLFIAAMLYIIYKSAIEGGRVSKLLMLNTKIGNEEGYSSTPRNEDLVGLEGIALTGMRPTGTGEFQGRKLDVITDGEFIPKGAPIKIAYVEGFRIVVKRLDEE